MRCSVLQTHRNGVRLAREELRTMVPSVGNLLLADHEGNRQRRGKYARLAYAGPSVRADLLLPIFDVQLLKIVDEGFLLQGYEILASEVETKEVVQGWWCKPVVASSEYAMSGNLYISICISTFEVQVELKALSDLDLAMPFIDELESPRLNLHLNF